MAVIEVEGLRKSYGPAEVLHGVSFTVQEGEVVAVLGPNGAGKTTTVEIMEGYRTRDAGSVKVLGLDPATGGTELRQRIGIVLQECGFDHYLTVNEMLQMHAEFYRHPRSVDEVVTLVGLEEKRKSRVKTLSGGQKRRLDVALGLIGDPELLFLDEPTTGFDPTARRQAWDVVRNLAALGKTVLLTTHYLDEAEALADRVLVFAAGKIVAEGSPETIGGRASAATEIRFVLPPGATVEQLPVPATLADGVATVSTASPTSALHLLTGWALDKHGELEQLTVTRPSLENVYLALTGDAEEKGS